MNYLPGHTLAVEDNRIKRLELFRSLQGYIVALVELCWELENLGRAGAAELLSQAAYEEIKTALQTIR